MLAKGSHRISEMNMPFGEVHSCVSINIVPKPGSIVLQ